MSNKEEQVLVIPRAVLFGEGREVFQGFSKEVVKYTSVFTKENLTYRPRSTVETEPEYKQIIPYLVFTQGNKILAYQRTSKGGEGRLHGKWSIGFGGHMNDGDNGIIDAILRERSEELSFDWTSTAGIQIGLINDDSTAVGEVHLGLVYATEIPSGTPKPTNDDSLSRIAWREKDQLLASDLETWSRIVLENFVTQ